MTTPLKVRTAALLLGAVAFAATTFGAHAAGAAEPTPTLTSVNVDAGGGDNVTGGGCVARATVQIQIDGVVLATTKSSATGSYSVHLIIPVSAKPGSHRLTVVCAGPAGQVSTDTSITVNLPRTGSSSERDASVAFGFLAVGVFLVAASKRRAINPRDVRANR
jgi:hypothetical protein